MAALKGVDGFLFGCDPELFVRDEDGNLVSAHGLIPGTKEAPHKVERGAIQVDGMAAEFNIDPVDNFEDWNTNIIEVLKQLKAALPKGHRLSIESAVRFTPEIMDAMPDSAKALGCDPDYNAWDGSINPPPDMMVDPLLRTASGHVHIGWTKDMPTTDEIHRRHGNELGQQMDWFLGGWSARVDADITRRKLYGKAGAIRYKPYGVEYRVMSNFWLKDKKTREQVWNRMQTAITWMKKREYAKHYVDHNERLKEFINTGVEDVGMSSVFNFPLMRYM